MEGPVPTLTAGLVLVRHYSSLMQEALESGLIPEAMKYASNTFAQLRTPSLSPRDYYELFSSVFDETRVLETALIEDSRLDGNLAGLYEQVQYGFSVLPRLYLLVTVGAAAVRAKAERTKETVFDLLEMVKGVQNPVRGLFLRYYMNKSFKEILGRAEGIHTSDSIKFFLENLQEMTRLWVRIKPTSSDRTDLSVLMGENITRLSLLPGVTLDIYKESVLPRLLETVASASDSLERIYLLDGIVCAFPDDFHVYTLKEMMETAERTGGKSSEIAFAERMVTRFIRYTENEQGLANVRGSNASLILKSFIETLALSTETTESQALELAESLLKLLLKCYPEDFHFAYEVLGTIYTKLTLKEKGRDSDAETKLFFVLNLLMENRRFGLVQSPLFPALLDHLSPEDRAKISLQILKLGVEERTLSVEKWVGISAFVRFIISDFQTNTSRPSPDRDSALSMVAGFIHLLRVAPADFARVSAHLQRAIISKEDAIETLAPALLFAGWSTIRRVIHPDWLQSSELLLDALVSCRPDLGVKMSCQMALEYASQAQSLVMRSGRSWYKRISMQEWKKDTLILLIGTCEVLGKRGESLLEATKMCLDLTRSLSNKTDQCTALLAISHMMRTDPVLDGQLRTQVLRTVLRTADLTSPLQLVLVLNHYLLLYQKQTPEINVQTINRLIAFIRLQGNFPTAARRMLASIVTYIRNRQKQGDLIGVGVD